jgi:glycosyltransferase involved in cell wall biosynthesis
MSHSISIITIVFNGKDFIEETIISVLSQKKDLIFEYIIIDGGSTDGTIEIINKYQNDINIFISEKDDGIFDAINKGIRLASGNYIGLIHSGDLLCEHALKKVFDLFISTNSDVIYGDIIFLEHDNGHSYERYLKPQLHKIKNTMSIFHPSVFISKVVYDQIGLYRLDFPVAADYEFILRTYKKKYVFNYIEIPIAKFRTDGNSSTRFFDSIQDYFKIHKLHYSLFFALFVFINKILIASFYFMRRNFALLVFGKKLFYQLKINKYSKSKL